MYVPLADDCGLLDKAADLGARILDTFSNQTALLAGKMRLTGEPLEHALHRSPRGLHAPVSALAEIGTFSLEFASLAYHTGDTSYIARLDAAMDVIERTKMENGLFFVGVRRHVRAAVVDSEELPAVPEHHDLEPSSERV